MGFFDVSSGPSILFKTIGETHSGTITAPYTERQSTDFATDKPRVDEQGRPVMMACVPLQTSQRDPSIPNDDGVRTLYVDKVGLKIAIGEAIKSSGAPDLEVGGTLSVTWTGETPSTKGNPLKTWAATYVRPTGSLAPPKPTVTTTSTPAVSTPPPAVTTSSATPDLVAIARAAQEKAAADQAAMTAQTAAPAPATNGADPTADLLKIRELNKLGFDAASIHAAMPGFSLDAITAVLAI